MRSHLLSNPCVNLVTQKFFYELKLMPYKQIKVTMLIFLLALVYSNMFVSLLFMLSGKDHEHVKYIWWFKFLHYPPLLQYTKVLYSITNHEWKKIIAFLYIFIEQLPKRSKYSLQYVNSLAQLNACVNMKFSCFSSFKYQTIVCKFLRQLLCFYVPFFVRIVFFKQVFQQILK